jgi:hypothetical protein
MRETKDSMCMVKADAKFISLVHDPKWNARIYRDGNEEGIVLTPGKQLTDDLQTSNGGRDPVCALSVVYCVGCQASVHSLLDAEIEKHKKNNSNSSFDRQTPADPNEEETSCLINYTLLFPLNDPRAKRLGFAVHYRFVKRERGVLRFEVRARDFFIKPATEAATALFTSVVIKP